MKTPNTKGTNKYLPTDVKNLWGTKDVSMLMNYYNIDGIFVSAYIADKSPSTLLEKVVCGTPVVAIDVGGVPKIVIYNETCLLVNSKDEKDLSEKMKKLLIDNNLCQRLDRECRGYAISNFSMDNYCK